MGVGSLLFITALLLLILAQNVSPFLPVGNMTSINYSDLSPLGKIVDIDIFCERCDVIILSLLSFSDSTIYLCRDKSALGFPGHLN